MSHKSGSNPPSPICSACHDFTADGEQFERRTIVIVPIVIDECEPGLFKIAWGCSRGHVCMDKHCRYNGTQKNFKQNDDYR